MCDESDVEQSLKTLIVGYLYPNGTSQACAAGVPCKVVRGWPTTQDLDNIKAQSASGKPGMVLVSVCTRAGIEKNTTRYSLGAWMTVSGPTHTLTATVGGAQQNQITIGGTVATPQNVIALIGGSLQKQAFVYAVQASDTLNTIAAGLASAIAENFSGTTSNGAVVTINSTLPVTARIASLGSAVQIAGTQDKEFQITIWSPPCNVSGSDADNWRNAVAKIIDPPLRALNRIMMVDQVAARIKFERTITIDKAQSQGIYRRDLFYWIEYNTTIAETYYEIGVAKSQLQGGQSVVPGTTTALPPDNTTNS